MEKQEAAQHIFSTLISDQLRITAFVPNRNAEMMIATADILGQSRLCPGKYEQAGLTIAAELVAHERRPGFRPVDDDA